ncbi:MAG TPA: PDZ domain-containing protein, partial [Bradyrhizobium sp.]|nr:PDZ domain-containing protein [Bradyrhizobium sp.]
AAAHGFKQGDVILEVAGKNVSNPGEVRDAIKTAHDDKKNTVLMRVKTGDASRYVAIPLGNG